MFRGPRAACEARPAIVPSSLLSAWGENFIEGGTSCLLGCFRPRSSITTRGGLAPTDSGARRRLDRTPPPAARGVLEPWPSWERRASVCQGRRGFEPDSDGWSGTNVWTDSYQRSLGAQQNLGVMSNVSTGPTLGACRSTSSCAASARGDSRNSFDPPTRSRRARAAAGRACAVSCRCSPPAGRTPSAHRGAGDAAVAARARAAREPAGQGDRSRRPATRRENRSRTP